MAVNKVIYGGETIIDLTSDTVEESNLLVGYTAHGADGEVIEGACTFDSDTTNATAREAEILVGKSAYVNGSKIEGTMVNNESITGSIALLNQQYTIPVGYHDGGGKVGILDEEKLKIVPNNIRQGINILGVIGTMSGTEDVMAEAKTVTPTTASQIVLPDTSSGYNYISQVTVEPIPYIETENEYGGMTVTIAGSGS